MSPRWLVGPVVVTMLTFAAGPVAATAGQPPPGSSAQSAATGPLVDSEYLAGYDQSGAFVDARIKKFVVPELDCTTEPTGIEIGIGFEPVAGSPLFTAGVRATCQHGVASYLMVASIGEDREESSEVSAGDRISVRATLDFVDLYVSASNKSNPKGNVSVVGFDPGVEGVTYGALPVFDPVSGDLLAVPDFGKVTLKGATAEPGSTELDRVGDPGINASKKKGGVAAPTHEAESAPISLKYVVHCCSPFDASAYAG